MTFTLGTPEGVAAARGWDYFEDGARQLEAAGWIRPHAVRDHREQLDPAVVWGYHSPGMAPDTWLSTEVVDYYRCWADAGPQPDLARAGVLRQAKPLIIYSNGTHAVLGDGNHRLAAAKRAGLEKLPVKIVPDRLLLADGMDASHLRPLEPEVKRWTGVICARHNHGGLFLLQGEHHVDVFCPSGAQWKRKP